MAQYLRPPIMRNGVVLREFGAGARVIGSPSDEGCRRITGQVLAENDRMIEMRTERGFHSRRRAPLEGVIMVESAVDVVGR